MSQQRRELKWLIAHHPAYLFIRTAEAFNQELEKLCPGEFNIEALTMRDYINKYGDIPYMEKVPTPVPGLERPRRVDDELFEQVEWSEIPKKWKAIFNAMREEKFHLSQTQITVIGGFLHEKFAVLDLPFLFKDHDHLSKVLDGEIGDQLCEELGQVSGVKGLGFTYSGGYRIIGSNTPIESIDGLKDVNIVTTPMSAEFFSNFAKTAKNRAQTKIVDVADIVDEGGAVETTYLRYNGKNVLKTNHSMFLTNIMVSESFFNTLTPVQQEAFKKAAKIVAKLEREWSIEDAAKYEREAESRGITITEISEEETAKLKAAAPQQYSYAYGAIPGSKELVYNIRTTS